MVVTAADIQHVAQQLFARRLYSACLLVVYPEIARLKALTSELTTTGEAWPCLAVGKVVSAGLLDVPPQRRPHGVERILGSALAAMQGTPIVCTDIDLLFEPTLHLDPLALFRLHGQRAKLVVFWPGTFDGRTLAYATPEHAHFRHWTEPELCDTCIQSIR